MNGEHDETAENIALLAASGLFDGDFYRDQRADLGSVADPVRHYLEIGWREDLDPSSAFDTAAYLEAYDDVRASGMNPLVHFVRHGKGESRVAFGQGDAAGADAPAAQAPSAAEWAALPRREAPGAPGVDVVIPVYRGADETLRCIYSVLAATPRTGFELWVVDDASPEPALSEALDELAADGRIRLLRNPSNIGFVRSCNIAMRLHPERDVVLLNSDTEVFGDWLDRLRAAASLPHVGTVTPFSNNAEICSYPAFIGKNRRPLELSDAELDAIFADVNRAEVADLPTAIGFCVYVRRACLDAAGMFDEDRFGLGYGEENDLCRRAAGLGWRNVLAADVFVRHYGGVSFGASKAQRVQSAQRVLAELHPEYAGLVSTFIEDDPLAPYRRRADVARARRALPGRVFLFVTHDRGGGTERHARDMAERIAAEGGRVVFARPEPGNRALLRFEIPGLIVPNLGAIDVTGGVEEFARLCAALGIDHIHVHQLADWDEAAADFLRVAAERLRIRYDVTVHDYFVICPRITLIDRSGFYCGEPEEDECTRCCADDAFPYGGVSVAAWRDRSERFLLAARKVFVPNGDVRDRLTRYFPVLSPTVRPHPEEPRGFAPSDSLPIGVVRPGMNGSSRRRIGVIGAIGPHKGSRLLLACARIARERGIPLEFIVIGTTDLNDALREAGVTIGGRYAEDELQQLIACAQLDLAWFPSVWPETYSYTLSAALQARVFPVAFDLGAIADRLRAIRWGHLLPIESFFAPGRVVEELAGVATSPFPAHVAGSGPAPARGSFVSAYYELSAD